MRCPALCAHGIQPEEEHRRVSQIGFVCRDGPLELVAARAVISSVYVHRKG